jgi:hypothetical protein
VLLVKNVAVLATQHAKQVKQAKLPHPASHIVQPNAVSLRLYEQSCEALLPSSLHALLRSRYASMYYMV